MSLHKFFGRGVLALAAATSLNANAGVVIDLFTDPAVQQVDTNSATPGIGASSEVGYFPATILGGYREMSIVETHDGSAGGNGSSGGVNSAEAVAGAGKLSISNGDDVKSRTMVTWDGVGSSGLNGGLGIDLTGADHFLAQVLRADLGFDYEITVRDADGSQATLFSSVLFSVTPGDNASATYAFSWFNLATGLYELDGLPFSMQQDAAGGIAGIDFSAVTLLSLALENEGAVSADFALGRIETVPEPGALALVGIALLGAGAASRRGRVAKS